MVCVQMKAEGESLTIMVRLHFFSMFFLNTTCWLLKVKGYRGWMDAWS